MINFGAVPAGAVLPIMFNTYAAATGASVTLTGLAVTDIEVYKGTSMTQRASDAGFTLLDTDGIDIDGTSGIHGFSIDTGDNTDASFYAAGSFFTVVVSAVTVDSQTVNFVAATFRIVAAEAIAGKPKADVDAWLGTAAATPTTAGVPEVDVTHWIGTACATPTVAGVPEVDLTHVAGATTSVSALATNAASSLLYATRTTLRGTASGTPTTTSIPTSAMTPATSVADQLKGRIVVFDDNTTTAALRGQATDITASSASATPTLTVTALTTAPVSGDTFTVV